MYLKWYVLNTEDTYFSLYQWLAKVCGVWHRITSHNINTDIYEVKEIGMKVDGARKRVWPTQASTPQAYKLDMTRQDKNSRQAHKPERAWQESLSCAGISLALTSPYKPTVPKTYLFQIKRVLYYTSSGDSDTQNVLLSWEVVRASHTVDFHQVAAM